MGDDKYPKCFSNDVFAAEVALKLRLCISVGRVRWDVHASLDCFKEVSIRVC